MDVTKSVVTIGCNHLCPKFDGNKPHVGGPTLKGAKTVLVEGKNVCRKGDELLCMSPQKDKFKTGSQSVFIENEPTARVEDGTEHGGKVVMGAISVFIG